jgi:hypothetical protein
VNRFLAIAYVTALLMTTACGTDAGQRSRALDAAAARRLIGAWDVTLWLDRPITMASSPRVLPFRVSGTMAFVEDHYEQPSFPQLKAPTHSGVYDIDLSALGLPAPGEDAPAAIARAASNGDGQRDSVVMVINPGRSGPALLFRGAFDADSVVGVWISESLLGGGGRFVLARRH